MSATPTPTDPPGTPPRQCAGCGYILEHLSTPRCPECGRVFDPDDPRTFRRIDPQAIRRADLHMAALGMVTALLFVLVPWSALFMLRIAPPLVLAGMAFVTGGAFVLAWPVFLASRSTLVAFAAVFPACLIVAYQAAGVRDWYSVLAVITGSALAAALRFGLSRKRA